MVDSAIDRTGPSKPYADASAPLEEEESSIDLFALFLVLRRGRNTIFAVSFVVLALATVYAFLLPFQYTSEVSFIPPGLGGGSSMASALAGQLSALGGGDILGGGKNPADLYAGILRSRSIASEVVKRFDLMHVYRAKKESQAERALDANTVVTVDVKSSIVTVGVTANSPVLAHDIASAFMDALSETNKRLALGQSSQRRLFFGQQLAQEKNDLEDAEVELKKTEEQSGLIEPSGQTESGIRTIAETQAQIASRQVELAALREGGTDQNADVVRLRSEIGDLQGQLARLQDGSVSKSTGTIPTSKVPEVQLQYVRKQREVKYHEALFEMLSRQYEAARMDEARDAPVLQVLDAPSYPDTKSGPKRSLYMLGGLVVGFLGSSIWVLVRDRIREFRASLVARDIA